jgi:G3E family GTPase
MGIKDRAMALTEGAKNRRIEDHNDRIERDNDRLRIENQALKGEMDRDRDRLSTLLDSLESTSTPAGSKSHRLRGLFTLTAAAAGAYVMGAKAGRERYEQIRDRWSQMRDRQMSRVRETGQEWADRAGSTVEDAGERASDAIQTASQKAASAVQQAGTQAAASVSNATESGATKRQS